MQISHPVNYCLAGDAIGVGCDNLVNHPELLISDKTLGWKSAVWYFLNYPDNGCQSADTLGAYTACIMGENSCDSTQGCRALHYQTISNQLGIQPESNNLCCPNLNGHSCDLKC